MTSPDTSRAVLVGVGGAALAFFIFRGSSPAGAVDPLDAIPRGSFLVATVDVGAVQRSPLYESMIGKDEAARALGMGSLVDACGFDPITRVAKLAVAVPEEGDKGEFGLAAKVNVSASELEKCTSGLGSGKKLETKQLGPFVAVESPSGSRVAYGLGLLVVGRGTWLDAMLGAAEKKAPSAKNDPEHAALRARMNQTMPGAAIVATAILPKKLRDKLKADQAREVEDGDASATAMAGVYGVGTVGVALDVGETIRLDVELGCDTADACNAVEKLIQKQRSEWLRDIRFRLVGITPLVESLAVVRGADPKTLSVTGRADTKQVAAAINRITMFGGRGAPSTSAMPQPPKR